MTRRIFLSSLTAVIAARSAHAQQARSLMAGLKLLDLEGHPVNTSIRNGDVTVVVFMSTRCPMSNAHNHRMNVLYNEYMGRVRFLFLNSNANESLEEVRVHAREVGFDFPIYKDLNNRVADLFGAEATPDTFVVDSNGVVRYHGYIDDAPNPERVRNPALRLAIDAVLEGRKVATPETRTFGCSIKRAKGAGPESLP